MLLREYLAGRLRPVLLAGALRGPLAKLWPDAGSRVTVAGAKNLLLLSFWSPGCAPSFEELPRLAATVPAITAQGLPMVLVSRKDRTRAERADSTMRTLTFAVDRDGALHNALRQQMTRERFLVAVEDGRAWRVGLPVGELPLLAGAIRAGVLAGRGPSFGPRSHGRRRCAYM